MKSPDSHITTYDRSPRVVTTALVGVLALGTLGITAKTVSDRYEAQLKANQGCTGSTEYPVSSHEPLSDFYARLGDAVEENSGTRPSKLQLITSVSELNLFGLGDEAADVKAGKVPKGRSVLLGPEWCPDPTPQS